MGLPPPPGPLPPPPALFGSVPFAPDDRARIKRALGMQLGPEFVASRQGPGGAKLSYVEGWKVVNLANEIFGFDGWSSHIVGTTVDYCEVDARGISLGCSCTVRVTLKDGTYREDVGWGSIANAKDKGQAFEKVRKEAATDALKRSLKSFGNALGNCVYDKEYLKQIPKIKMENMAGCSNVPRVAAVF
ncbi:hypothetical protein DFJ74DRAFT_605718 [Hyaloraphidium curvatum]|nr:hypothetical protein DFJ74DRAFT_605718 [Hyaloraphidium curvatum]